MTPKAAVAAAPAASEPVVLDDLEGRAVQDVLLDHLDDQVVELRGAAIRAFVDWALRFPGVADDERNAEQLQQLRAARLVRGVRRWPRETSQALKAGKLQGVAIGRDWYAEF